MHLILLISTAYLTAISPAAADHCVIANFASSTEAPHGGGNLYAPEIVNSGGKLLMFFGAQGKDGHDRIHLAVSKDGERWQQKGVVFAPHGVNHVNDPSVVIVAGTFYMYYTLAKSGVTDSIGLATSTDGLTWIDAGSVFGPSPPPSWDSLLVGRPSVMHHGEEFEMWYDGRKDLPVGAPDATAPTSATSRRFVGYATSRDGKHWNRRAKPVFAEDAGGVHVTGKTGALVMVIESREGTKWATSSNGIDWKSRGILHPKNANSPFGHVTPFLYITPQSTHLYYGAAAAATWDRNSIFVTTLEIPADPDVLHTPSSFTAPNSVPTSTPSKLKASVRQP